MPADSHQSRRLQDADRDHAAFSAWLRTAGDDSTDRVLNRHASRRQPPLVLTGGESVSRRLACWVERYALAHDDTPVFLHHTGCSLESRDPEHLLYRLLGFIRSHCGLRETIPVDPAARRELLPNWLARLAAGGRAVLVLDRLDALTGVDAEATLDWLPVWLPSALRVVISSAPGATLELLRYRQWELADATATDAECPALTAADRLVPLVVARRGLPEARLAEAAADAVDDSLLRRLCFRVDDQVLLAGPEPRDAIRHQHLQSGADWQRAQQRLAIDCLAAGGNDDLVDGVWLLQQARDWSGLAAQLGDPAVLRCLLSPERLDVLLDVWHGWGNSSELLQFYRDRLTSWLETQAAPVDLIPDLLQALWRLAEAEDLLPAVRQARAWPGAETDAVVAALDALEGACLLELDDLAAAHERLTAAMASSGARQGPDAPETRRCRHRLAMVLEQQGMTDHAIRLYRQALAAREASLGAKHRDLIPHLINLAAILRADNRLDEARPLYQRALQLAEREYGGAHPQTAACLDSLAGVLYAGHDLDQAETLYQRALGIAETAFGPAHPATAASAHNLGAVLDAREQFQAAEMLFRRALEIRQQVFGDEHVDTASSLHNLAGALDAMGRFNDAEPLYRQAIDVWEQVVGKDHTATATSVNNLADLLREQGRYAEAEGLYRRNLETWGRLLGADHPHTVMTRSELAILLSESTPGAEAEALLQAATRETAEVMGWDSMQHINTVVRYASVLRDSRRRTEARSLLRTTLSHAEGKVSLLSPRLQKLKRHLEALEQNPDSLH